MFLLVVLFKQYQTQISEPISFANENLPVTGMQVAKSYLILLFSSDAHLCSWGPQTCPQLVHTALFKRLFIREKCGESLQSPQDSR